jgi:hypothetical protein
MAKQKKKSRQSSTLLHEFVTVAFAEDMELSKQYKKMLGDNDIPAAINDTKESSHAPGIAVMVPEDYLDEAHVLIESQSSNDSFYDLAFNDSLADEIVSDDFDEDDDDFYDDI